MRQKEAADCQWPNLGDRDTGGFSPLFSVFSWLCIFCSVFFITVQLFALSLSVPLSFLLPVLSFPAVFIPLPYIQTCYYLSLSSSLSPMATWQWASPSIVSLPLLLSLSKYHSFFSLFLLAFFLSLALSFAWCEDASFRRALGPRSQDAGLWSWRWGWRRCVSRWVFPLADVGSSQDSPSYLRGPVAGPGTSRSHTAAQGSLEGTQGRPPRAREEWGKHMGWSKEGGGDRGGEAGHTGQEHTSGR